MALGDMMGMMKQAKQLQEKMQSMQDEVAAMEIEGSAGGGMVTVTMNGKGEVKGVRIDPSLLKPYTSPWSSPAPRPASSTPGLCRLPEKPVAEELT